METFRGCESGVKEHEENMTSFEATEESPRRLDTLPYDVLLRLMDHIPSGDLQRGIYATNKQLRGILCQEDFWKNRLKSRCQECRVIQRTDVSSGSSWRRRAWYVAREDDVFRKNQHKKYGFRVVEQGHRINAVAFIGSGKYVAVGGNDHRVAVWCLDRITTDDSELTEEIRMEQSRSVLHKHSDWVTSLTYKNGKLSSASMDRTIRIFDLQQIHDKLPSFPAITLRSGRGIFCHDRGDNLLVAGMHSAIELFDLRCGALSIMNKSADDENMNLLWDIVLLENPHRVLLVSSDATVRSLDLRTKRFDRTATLPTGEHGVRMEVKDGLCWIGTNGGKLLLYDDQSLEFLEDYSAYFDFSSEHRVVGLHYNDAHLLACSASGSVKMLEAMKRPKVLWEWQSDLDLGLRVMDFSTDCSLLVTSADQAVLWQPSSVAA